MITLFDNYDMTEEEREDIIDRLLEDYDMVEGDDPLTREELENEYSHIVYETWEEEMTFCLEELLRELSNELDGYIIAYGSVGRWDGTYEGAEIYKDFEDAWYELTKDCDYFKIDLDDNGTLKIECSHHDGDCHYNIRKLTNEGVDIYDEWSYNWDDNTSEKDIKTRLINDYTEPVELL